MAIPIAMRGTYDGIAPLIEAFCDAHLSDEYLNLCLKLLEKLCRKRPSPLLLGKDATWAAGIVYAIAANNFIFSKDNPLRMSAAQLAAPFGLSISAASLKASEIRRLIHLSSLDNHWLILQYQEEDDIQGLPYHHRQLFERFGR